MITVDVTQSTMM